MVAVVKLLVVGTLGGRVWCGLGMMDVYDVLDSYRSQSDEIMVSFDVTSLFTSIPPNLAHEVLRKRLEEAYDETQNALKIEHLMQLFEFCQQTFFTFAGETYEQIKGTPIGSPVFGLVAELVRQELGKLAFIQHEPVFGAVT
ncbi:hypothetical protein SprV_0401503700 [Sparganum proliferum]